jgi:hypothetical protein
MQLVLFNKAFVFGNVEPHEQRTTPMLTKRHRTIKYNSDKSVLDALLIAFQDPGPKRLSLLSTG